MSEYDEEENEDDQLYRCPYCEAEMNFLRLYMADGLKEGYNVIGCCFPVVSERASCGKKFVVKLSTALQVEVRQIEGE